jgi:hypothetical protein
MESELRYQLDAVRCAYESFYEPNESVRAAYLAAESAFELFQMAFTERERVRMFSHAQDAICTALQAMEQQQEEENYDVEIEM